MFFISGCILASGINITSAKLVIVLILQWCTSPLASHMMAKFEYLTDDRLYENCAFEDRTAESAAKEEETDE